MPIRSWLAPAQRYVTPDGRVRWPPNCGAVPGTRVLFEDPEEFIALYGNQLDRIGPPDGGYLGIPPGTPFAQRALPPSTLDPRPSTLDDTLRGYAFTGKLPPGVTIEVSEVAPAFGRPGGGIQVRFMDGTESIDVAQLIHGKYAGTLL